MYDKIANYYDLTHDDLTEDIAYILTLAERAKGPVLELGCGSGRLLVPLARAGYTVSGLDNSAAMLGRARSRLEKESELIRERVTLIEADMAAFQLPGDHQQFALVLVPYNTLMHLEPGRMLKCLKNIRRTMRPDGWLFIDLINPAVVAQTPNDRSLTLENQLVDPDTGEIILQMASNWLEEPEQILHITWIYDAVPAEGGAIHRTVAQAVYHYLYPHQLEMLLDESDFRLESLSGDYEDTPFQEESDRLLLLARPR